MNRLLAPATAVSFALLATLSCGAQAAAKKPAHKPAATKKAEAPKPEADNTPLTEAQLAVVPRVFTGTADCEFKQTVALEPVSGHEGHFSVSFGKARYDMVPEETTTGAVRLHDKKADVVWVQIPVKSMLLDSKAGHRLVDACQVPQQRAAVEAIEQTRLAARAAGAAASAASAAQQAAAGGSGTGQAFAQDAAQAADRAAQAASAAAQAASTAVSVSAPSAGGLGIVTQPPTSH